VRLAPIAEHRRRQAEAPSQQKTQRAFRATLFFFGSPLLFVRQSATHAIRIYFLITLEDMKRKLTAQVFDCFDAIGVPLILEALVRIKDYKDILSLRMASRAVRRALQSDDGEIFLNGRTTYLSIDELPEYYKESTKNETFEYPAWIQLYKELDAWQRDVELSKEEGEGSVSLSDDRDLESKNIPVILAAGGDIDEIDFSEVLDSSNKIVLYGIEDVRPFKPSFFLSVEDGVPLSELNSRFFEDMGEQQNWSGPVEEYDENYYIVHGTSMFTWPTITSQDVDKIHAALDRVTAAQERIQQQQQQQQQ
jgi:hypothetical protein